MNQPLIHIHRFPYSHPSFFYYPRQLCCQKKLSLSIKNIRGRICPFGHFPPPTNFTYGNKKDQNGGKRQGNLEISRKFCSKYRGADKFLALPVGKQATATDDFEFHISFQRLRWSKGKVLAFSTQVRGFKPGRSRRIFKGRKNPHHAFLRRGSKAVGPMQQICGM